MRMAFGQATKLFFELSLRPFASSGFIRVQSVFNPWLFFMNHQLHRNSSACYLETFGQSLCGVGRPAHIAARPAHIAVRPAHIAVRPAHIAAGPISPLGPHRTWYPDGIFSMRGGTT
jgi:hypothetical protein